MLLCIIPGDLTTHPTNDQNLPLSKPLYVSHVGLTEPWKFTSLAWLRLIQMGIQRTHNQRVSSPPRVCLPVTLAILSRVKMTGQQSLQPRYSHMLWAAACLCFFVFFHSGEITIPSRQTNDPAVHLSWGDIAADNRTSPTAIWVYLKKSKSNQLGKA